MSLILVTDLVYETGAAETGMREVTRASDKTDALSNRDGSSNGTCLSPSSKTSDVWEKDAEAMLLYGDGSSNGTHLSPSLKTGDVQEEDAVGMLSFQECCDG